MDWVSKIAEEGRSSGIIRTRDLVTKFGVLPGTASVALLRLQRRGFVERVTDGLYINRLAKHFDPKDLINALRPKSYLSLDSALKEWGVSTQSPFRLTCISLERPSAQFKTESIEVNFRKIRKNLFWGFKKRKTRYSSYNIAEPEKALLDWVYFRNLDGLPAELDEFHLEGLNGSILAQYARRYPKKIAISLYQNTGGRNRDFLDSLLPVLFESMLGK